MERVMLLAIEPHLNLDLAHRVAVGIMHNTGNKERQGLHHFALPLKPLSCV